MPYGRRGFCSVPLSGFLCDGLCRLIGSGMLPTLVHPEPVVGMLADVFFEYCSVPACQLNDIFIGVGLNAGLADFLEDDLIRSILLPHEEYHDNGSPRLQTER